MGRIPHYQGLPLFREVGYPVFDHPGSYFDVELDAEGASRDKGLVFNVLSTAYSLSTGGYCKRLAMELECIE